TTTAMSVTFAPRARMGVNASWPGVSRNTTPRSPRVTSLAPICRLLPPRSAPGVPAAAAVLGPPAAPAGRDRRRADGVEEARLAVIDVAHDRDDRRAIHGGRGVVLGEQ